MSRSRLGNNRPRQIAPRAGLLVHAVATMGGKFDKADMIKKLITWLIFRSRVIKDKFRVFDL